MASITCWDGVECIGGNKILLEDGDARIWLDFGLDFGRMGLFYEEYLKPKGPLGIYEPVQMELIPPFRDLYRDDLVSALADPWVGIEGRDLGEVSGVLISHAHMDHVGTMSYLRGDIPLYASAVSLAMLKATQDSGKSGFDTQHCYVIPYEPDDSGVLKSSGHTKVASRARPFFFVDEAPGSGFQQFWGDTPSSLSTKGRGHESRPIETASTCGGLNVKRWPVDHSVYGACAWAVETSAGWVVYTGDIRCHGRNADLTWRFAEEAGKLNPVALIIEGTRVSSRETGTEDQVREAALEEIRKATGLVVADFGARNVERLDSFLQVAMETDRRFVITAKDVYLLEAMALAGADVTSLDDENVFLYGEIEGSDAHWKKGVRSRYASRTVTCSDVAADQGAYICCFSFFDVNELAYIRPALGSMWLFSGCEAFNEEMNIDFKRLGRWIERYGMAFPGDPRRQIEEERAEHQGSPFHVSGHACRRDLLRVIEMINPRCVIPVHTTAPRQYADELGSSRELLIPERGVPITLKG